MTLELILVIILLSSIVLLIINTFFIKKHLIVSHAKPYEISSPLTPSSPLLGTFCRVGFILLGNYRDVSGTQVAYRFVSVIIPIIPIGCYRIKRSDEGFMTTSMGMGNYTVSIYGKESWRFWEVVHAYIQWYASATIVMSILYLIAALFSRD